MADSNELKNKLGEVFRIADKVEELLKPQTGAGLQAAQVAVGTAALATAAAAPVLWPVAAVAGLVWWLTKK
jgi:hypothetical protein